MPRIVTLPSLALAAALAAPAAVSAADAQPAAEPTLTAPLALGADAAAAAALAAEAEALAQSQVEAADSAAPEGTGIILRPTAVVGGPYVRLSDLFDGVADDKDAIVAAAPRPGEQTVYVADWLEARAREHGLAWTAANSFEQVTVVRDSQIVGRTEIIEALRPRLVEQGMPPQAEIVLNTRDNSIPVPAGMVTAVGIIDVGYDPSTHRFTALIEVPAGSPTAARQRVTGRVHLMTAVPVLVSSMRQGEVIGEHDIDWVTVRVDQLRRDTITDPERLIGHTPRRFVQAGAPVQAIDVDRPRLITKGSVVTMVYHTPYMQLTAQGRALEHGGQGDQVRVQNMQSNQTVTGVVTDQNLVTVQIGPAMPLR